MAAGLTSGQIAGRRATPRRGAPLLALGLVLACWALARLALGQSLLIAPPPLIELLGAEHAGSAPWARAPASAAGRDAAAIAPSPTLPVWQPAPLAPWPGAPLDPAASAAQVAGAASASRLVGHAMLLAAGLAHLPPGAGLERHLDQQGPALAQPNGDRITLAPYAAGEFLAERRADRWSVDSWMLLRADTGPPTPAIQPSFGRSQAGAVLRYALAPGNAHRPQAYARVYSAIGGQREAELALGVSARPLPRVPVRVMAEARVASLAQGTITRTAVLAVSEFAPVQLPGGLSAEAYLQAGYVTGELATGFVDGLARASREVLALRDFRLSAGAGAWGGAQDGAERLDVGPSATLGFPLGAGFGRLAAEYRFRVLGAAEPASGPALTLAAGF